MFLLNKNKNEYRKSCRNTKDSIVCYGYHQQQVSIDQNYCVFLGKKVFRFVIASVTFRIYIQTKP